jgi:hypothetical protein
VKKKEIRVVVTTSLTVAKDMSGSAPAIAREVQNKMETIPRGQRRYF